MAADQQHMDVIDAAKAGDQHRLRSYLDERNGDVNLRDDSTQGTLLHTPTTFIAEGRRQYAAIKGER
ncbi:unnamed protein product [Ectocarpus sp. CCAP 1310/34]|nr:unnamed protein product [Ectocarpus sp. CCAP 1310/34]